MSRRRLEFEKASLRELSEAAKNAWTIEVPVDVLSGLDKEDYERLIKGLALVGNYIECVDPDLLPSLNWPDFAQQLVAIRSAGDGFRQQRRVEFLLRAMEAFDVILARYVITRSVVISRKYAKSFNSSLSKMTECIGEQLGSLSSKKDELIKLTSDLHASISGLQDRYNREEQKIGLQVQQHQEQFSQAQEKRQIEYASAQEKRQEKFNSDESARDKEFHDKTQKLEIEANELKSRLVNDFDELKKDLEEKAAALLSQMEDTKKKTESIYGIVGKESVVGSQKAYADNAKDLAHWLFGVAVVIMIFVAGLVVWPLLSAIGNSTNFSDVNWILLACRIPITAILLLPAFYLANEAKKQREKENYYRELEIKLAAVSPYFAGISGNQNGDLPEKDRVMMELAKGMLAIREQKEDKHVVLSPDVLELIKTIVPLIKDK